MKKFFLALFVVLFATSMMAQRGLTCEDPIPVDSNYQAHVDGPCELWYTAGTYDLPLHVYFLPDTENSTWGPEVVVDFTCEEGVYDDPNIANLVGSVSDFGYTLPIELLCDQVIREGKVAYDLEIGKFYRDQLTEYGINYNVQAFVKVSYSESGRITLRPDTVFRSCIENAHYIELGDKLEIQADDANSVFVAALPDWKNDSIRFVWDGIEPVRMYFATTECNFTPSATNEYVYKYYDIEAGTPLKMYSDQMKADIDKSKDGGIFYVKFLSSVAGNLTVEKIPMDPPAGGAILLEYDKSVSVPANDSQNLYAILKKWSKATAFVGSGAFELQVSNNYAFDTSVKGAFVNTYSSAYSDGTYLVGLTSAEMKAMTARAVDNYLYVRFVSAKALTVVPRLWEVSECLDNTVILPANTTVIISSSSTIYRFKYAEFQGADLKIKWDGAASMTTYIGDTCIFSMSTSNSHVIYNKRFSRKGSTTIAASVVDSWASGVDEDGYLYVRFNPQAANYVTFITEKPITPDPVYTTETAAICFGEGYDWNGKTYTETGKYTYTTEAANGADSIVTLTLTVYPQTPATTEEVTVKFGETYEWNGTVYTESGEYTTTLQDKNGCDYQATLILTVEAKPVSPCVAASTLLEPIASLTLNLGKAFDIYRIDYQAWLASGVNLVWTGKGALHTFVAKDCEFAVAIYHKDVVNYTEVPAEGNVVLSKAILAPLAQYVDADGYLYVRFLTELEGQLTTTLAE